MAAKKSKSRIGAAAGKGNTTDRIGAAAFDLERIGAAAGIEQRVSTFVSELAALVRQAAVDAVADVLGSAKRGPGRPKAAGAPTAAKPSRAAAPATRGRRTPEQIAASVASVLGYIKAHPNARSEKIRAELKLPKPVMLDTLDRLRAAKKIKMKGVKRAATYSAA